MAIPLADYLKSLFRIEPSASGEKCKNDGCELPKGDNPAGYCEDCCLDFLGALVEEHPLGRYK